MSHYFYDAIHFRDKGRNTEIFLFVFWFKWRHPSHSEIIWPLQKFNCSKNLKIVQLPKKFISGFIKALISLFDLQSYEKKRKNLEIFFDFSISSAESMPMIEDNSVVLVTAGRAIQYFDFEKFFQDCNRILKPGQIWLLYCLHT